MDSGIKQSALKKLGCKIFHLMSSVSGKRWTKKNGKDVTDENKAYTVKIICRTKSRLCSSIIEVRSNLDLTYGSQNEQTVGGVPS